jgi:carboxyl-terminal processing protease
MSVTPSSPGPGAGRPGFYLSLLLVAALAGGAMFISGFTLGRESAYTGGTTESRQELFRPFWDAYNDIVTNYVGVIDEQLLVEGAIKGIFQALADPYSAYMTEEEYRQSLTGLSGQFEGIGAELATRETDGAPCATISPTCRLIITRVLRDSPALRAGLQQEDVILAVDGQPTLDSSLELTVPRIRGPKGTTVNLTIERAGEPLEVAIVRDVIQTESVHSRTLADGRIGYLRVDNFTANADADLHQHLVALVDGGIEAVILDLRDDPGGYVPQAQRIASEFVADRPLYWEQGAQGEPVGQPLQPISGTGTATDPAIAMVVLVNGGTASASEIVAATLQGHSRALLVGETTFGKGTIQEFKELPGAGGYRLSVRKWLTPDQQWINGVGLTPDVVVSPPADQPAGEDAVLDRAVELLLEQLPAEAAGALRPTALAAA